MCCGVPELHGPWILQASRNRIVFIVITTSSRLVQPSSRLDTRPRSGFDRERRVETISNRTASESPGRTGASQRSSSQPGEPRLDAGEMTWSTSIRIVTATVCQPDAIRPP